MKLRLVASGKSEYGELVKKIRRCATDPMHCLSCGEDKDGRCFKRLMTQAANAIEELSREAEVNAKRAMKQDNEICWSCVAMGGAGNYKESKTNADRIRAMSDEGLALFYAKKIASCYGCEASTMEDCAKCWLDWLKKEVR